MLAARGRRLVLRGTRGNVSVPAAWRGMVLAVNALVKLGYMIIDALIFFMFVAVLIGIGLLFTYATRKKRERHRN